MSEELERLLQPFIDKRAEKLAEKQAEKRALGFLVKLIKDGYITVNVAAEEAHMTVEEFEQKSGLAAT